MFAQPYIAKRLHTAFWQIDEYVGGDFNCAEFAGFAFGGGNLGLCRCFVVGFVGINCTGGHSCGIGDCAASGKHCHIDRDRAICVQIAKFARHFVVGNIAGALRCFRRIEHRTVWLRVAQGNIAGL